MSGLTVRAVGETGLVLTRSFGASRRLVYDALTRPELLVRWHGARGWNLVGCEVDLRVGGRYRFESRGPGGQEMAIGGEYREIVPERRLVFTEWFDEQSYPGETVVTTELSEYGDRTTVTTTVTYATQGAREIVLAYPMERGAGESYDRLEKLLLKEVKDELDA